MRSHSHSHGHPSVSFASASALVLLDAPSLPRCSLRQERFDHGGCDLRATTFTVVPILSEGVAKVLILLR